MTLLKMILNTVLVVSLLPVAGHAFMLGATRVVIYQDQGYASLSVIGGEKDPLYLIRARVTRTLNDTQAVPVFLITPPVFRLEPGGRNQIRINVASPGALPADRESVFYLKVQGIPSGNPLEKNSRAGFTAAQVQFGSGNIIKLFYRPRGLDALTPDILRGVTYSRVPGGIKVSNPTPYHITFGYLNAEGVQVPLGGEKQPVMVSPLSSQIYLVGRAGQGKTVEWRILDDDGKAQAGTSPLL